MSDVAALRAWRVDACSRCSGLGGRCGDCDGTGSAQPDLALLLAQAADEIDHLRNLKPPAGHGATCTRCGTTCDALASDTRRWPTRIYHDEWACQSCVDMAITERDALVVERDELAASLKYLYRLLGVEPTYETGGSDPEEVLEATIRALLEKRDAGDLGCG